MPETTFILNSKTAFLQGCCDNITIDGDTLTLSRAQGRYMQAGCFTTPEYAPPAFRSLVASWNCDTPPRTAVELCVRVKTGEEWSAWQSYGKWSPFLQRSSQSDKTNDKVQLDTDTLRILTVQGASAYQMRISLYTDDTMTAPRVFLIAASVQPMREQKLRGEPINRTLPVPAYSQKVRDPRIAGVMCSPTTITMLMNRYGEDILPEQAAHACYDYAYHGFGNWSYTTALAGAYGYECYVAYTDVEGLKKEIKGGHACGVSVRYAPTEAEAAEQGLPYLAGTCGCTQGHLMVVRGFAFEDGVEYVLANDPYAESDEKAERKYLLEQFEAAWSGMAYILHAKRDGAGNHAPARQCAELAFSETAGEYALHVHGARMSLPIDFCEKNGVCTGTVCYTVQNTRAYASAAHKTFYYTDISLAGNVILNNTYAPNTKLVVYLITHTGQTLVAELRI